MKKSDNFIETIETPEGDIIWNATELGGTCVDINVSDDFKTSEIQDNFTNTNGALVKNLSNDGKIPLGTS